MERAAAASFLRDVRMPPCSTHPRHHQQNPLRGGRRGHAPNVCFLHHDFCLLHHGVWNHGGPAATPGDRTTMEALTTRYWNHNVIGYDEKLSDGFYDVCGAPSDPGFQLKFPSLSALKSILAAGRDILCVAILVNRERDPVLKCLEGRAMAIAAQSRAQRGGLASAELVHKIAGLVVDTMGGVVEDADGMNREWFAMSL
ncbi:hypothetical protein QYE76_066527 [Lolium multiflorum]|uniref:EDR1/CTR1/ARMC3-like peptidase-like domain-containing protein n=1 Tax=Lolium multiflorum TaxID=4521 RepID=A0AAD8WC69_LOLMU|nr:hypothetical protein QYE76_066527 [Lolium multiflorum]